MPLKDQIKNFVRKKTESRPSIEKIRASVVPCKPLVVRFKDDGIVPNHPRWPMVVYRGAVKFPSKRADRATVVDAIFEMNGWGRSWRDSIYDFVHYHSQIHEVLGVAKGHARVEFGGIKGRALKLRVGDVVILPAGTGHRLLAGSRDFLVVGAYPAEGQYDECTDTKDRPEAKNRISKVARPQCDPIYGKAKGLARLWVSSR